MIRRSISTVAGIAVGSVIAVAAVASSSEPPAPVEYEPPLTEQCQAVMADPEGLASWLADRNGISPAKARQTVADAIANVCVGQ